MKENLTQPRALTYYAWSLTAGWTAVIVALAALNFHYEKSQAVDIARAQARSHFERDVTYRHWNAQAGPVYAPITQTTQPNPYLSALPERDIRTTEGKTLTMVNPAYMARLISNMSSGSPWTKGHLTSLRPIRPDNMPDTWEASALSSFTSKEQEKSTVEKMGDHTYFRLMKPLMCEEACLKCHAKQGYHVGDVRGGLSIAVPLEPLWAVARQNSIFVAISFMPLWGLGVAGIFFGSSRLRRAIRERDAGVQKIIALNDDLLSRTQELETANRELDAFCSTVSHDLRSPLTAVSGYCQLIQQIPEAREPRALESYIGSIMEAAQNMATLISALLDFSRVTRGDLVRCEADLSRMSHDIAVELQFQEQDRQAEFRIAEGLRTSADQDLARVVMHNLLGNAWKYSQGADPAVIEVGQAERDGEMYYYVKDNGIGLEQGQAERVFDAFHRLSNVNGVEGHGIGLATVKRIILRHGGKIFCESDIGKGATFYFSFGGATEEI
ncbi:sensor histidine kinase [Geomonas sp. Red276]